MRCNYLYNYISPSRTGEIETQGIKEAIHSPHSPPRPAVLLTFPPFSLLTSIVRGPLAFPRPGSTGPGPNPVRSIEEVEVTFFRAKRLVITIGSSSH